MKINVALFGLGRIGIMHAEDLTSHSKFNLKYVFDKNQKLSLKASRKFKCQNINNPSKAFTDNNIDLIFISSSTPTHISVSRETTSCSDVVKSDR